MRTILLCVFNFCLQIFSFAQNDIDVLHYKYNIGLTDVNDTLHGVAEINIKFLKPAKQVSFDLANPNNKGKGMATKKVLGENVDNFSVQNEKLNIFLSKTFNAGDSTTVIISYAGIPADGLIISKTKFGRRSFFADNWPDRGHNWIPCHDDPADKASVEFIVTAPQHYQVVANGVEIEDTLIGNGLRKTYWKEDVPISTKVMVIGVADFAVQLAGTVNGNIPVYSWVYPENKDNGFKDYAQATGIMEYYISRIGPYGYKKLANVQSKTRFGGLENANTIFYSENSVTGTRQNEGLLAHEIAHQWFGNMATEKKFGHLWLSEGFATYFTILYFENKYGKDTAVAMLKEDREQIISLSKESNKAIVDTTETNYMKLLNANSYQKGGWVLHILRSELGDSVFWTSIRKYYARYGGGIAGTEDLQKVFEEVSGNKLSTFFKQWVYLPGQPELDILWNYNDQSKEVTIRINQKQSGDFVFPLTISLSNSGRKSTLQKLYIDNKAKIFTIKVSEKPTSIIVDPDTELLASYTIKEN